MKRWCILIITICLILSGCKETAVMDQQIEKIDNGDMTYNTNIETDKVDNLLAFGKLYGYIRFFYPIQSTKDIDWDSFAIYGVEQVINANNRGELIEMLEELFYPIAPTIRLTENPDYDYEYRQSGNEEELYYMEHNGVGINDQYSYIYNSTVSRYYDSEVTYPKLPYVYEGEILNGVYAHIPIVLYNGDANRDVLGSNEYTQLKSKFIDIEDATGDEVAVRVADTIIMWNIIQHFYPYFQDLSVDWESSLEEYIKLALEKQSADEFVFKLREMIKPLEDGHGSIWLMDEGFKLVRLPFRVDYIEEEVVVTNSSVDDVKIGDVLLAIDDIPAKELLKKGIKDYCGSSQYKTEQALNFMTANFKGKENAKVALDRQGEMVNITLRYLGLRLSKYDYPKFKKIEEGIYYIRLTDSFKKGTLQVHLNELKNARGIIFDNRGYPRGDDIRNAITPYISDEVLTSPEYKIMNNSLPDRKSYTYFDVSHDYQPDCEKLLSTKFIFLINESAVSQAENMPYMVKHNNLGTLVGQPTAGANGNINSYTLPGQYYFQFTGLRIENPDGSRFHGIGIKPDYYVDYTIDDIVNGTDSYIDKAVEIIKSE